MGSVIVEYNRDNLLGCKCAECAVKLASPKSVEQEDKLKAILEQEDAELPDKMDVERAHCAVGWSQCEDIDCTNGRKCLCTDCETHDGMQRYWYCMSGSAEQIEPEPFRPFVPPADPELEQPAEPEEQTA